MKKDVFPAVIIALLLALPGRAAERRTVPGHVPEAVANLKLQPIGRLPATNHLRLAIGVASRDAAGLDQFVQEVGDPASPNFRNYLTPEQFTEKFGPTEADYQAVIDYATANGLTVTHMNSNRVVLDVEGPVSNLEKAMQVTFRTYQHPTEARTFFAPDVEPSVALAVPLLHIEGLDNYTRPFPKHTHRAVDPASAGPRLGSAPGGQLWGNDFRDAYAPGSTLTGKGQNLGLLEFESFYPSDITNYETAIGLNATNRPQLITATVDAAATVSSGGEDGEECTGDIEMAVAMAPGLKAIYIFENGAGDTNPHFDDILTSMVTFTNILQFSCSWGGTTAQDPTSEILFKQMITQGQSFFDASGDQGAFVGNVQFPSDSPSIMQVGGTTMTDGGAPNYPWQGEITWAPDSGPTVSSRRATSSAGGISTYYGLPTWQAGFNMATNLGSTTQRNFPDIAANADNDYLYTDDGVMEGGWGGTSFASPLWAGLVAMMNEQAAGCGEAPLGFLNPSLYALALTTNYTSCFHDITSGNNTWKSSPTKFYAVAGFDLCCGLGSPTGTNLINALAPPQLAVATNVQGNYQVFAGQSVTLTASFKGTGPFTYQWTLNGVPLSNGAGVTGATSNVLSLNPAVVSSTGTYQLLAANAYGTGQSGPAMLTVSGSPKISGPTAVGKSFIFSYPTVAGANYQLQSKTNLLSGPWISAGSPIAGTGASVSITNNISSTIMFYRLIVTP